MLFNAISPAISKVRDGSQILLIPKTAIRLTRIDWTTKGRKSEFEAPSG